MKKQVTFAKSQPLHRIHQDEALPRGTGMNEPQIEVLKDAGLNFSNGLKTTTPPPARTAAPFLKHSALTPAQREYLCTIAASFSTVHVRSLITQHYMNVLHRCRRAGCRPEGDNLVVLSVSSPGSDESDQQRSEVPPQAKHKTKISTSAKSPRKSFFPKIPNRPARLPNTSVSKQTKMKNHRPSPTLRRKSPRAKIRLQEEQEEEEGLDDPLNECLSSLSVGEWDDDTFSDL